MKYPNDWQLQNSQISINPSLKQLKQSIFRKIVIFKYFLFYLSQTKINYNQFPYQKKIFLNVAIRNSITVMSQPEINKLYNNILTQISKIYDKYEAKSRQLKQQNNKKTGSTIDKAESDLMKKIESTLEPQLQKLVNDMERVKSLKGRYSGQVKNCHSSIKSILKKKSFNFKINKQFNQLYDETLVSIKIIRQKIPISEQTTFLCCGVDGRKQMDAVINQFRIQAGRWEMIETLEPKGSVDNYICEEFVESDFVFIKQLLASNWPKQKQAQVRQVIKKVPVVQKVVEKVVQYVNVGDNKVNFLQQANQSLFGINCEENIVRGLKVYHDEADKGNNPDACSYLATIYQEGHFLPRDLVKSAMYYQKAIEKKHKYAMYRFAMGLIRGTFSKNLNDASKRSEQIKKAFNLINESISGKDPCPEGLAQMATLYQYGYFAGDVTRVQLTPIDIKKAISLNTKAMQLGLPRAMNNLGLIYYGDRSDKSDKPNENNLQSTKKAIQHFVNAQKHGYPQAYYNLGLIYKHEKQPEKALYYFYQGGRKNDYLSKIKFAYELMNQTSIEKEQFESHYRLALYWLEEVVRHFDELMAEGGSQEVIRQYQLEKSQATFYIGLFYEHGFGVEKSPKRAFTQFLLASESNYPPAKNKIGDCYFSGYGVTVNRELAIGCYLQAQSLQDSDAMVNLGTIYLNGIPGIVERNFNKAHEYFCKAIELENSDAMIHLSYMYRNGFGLQQDDQLAKKLLQEAAKNKNSTALYMLKQRGQQFDKNIYYDNLQNQFFSTPKRIDLNSIVPVVTSLN